FCIVRLNLATCGGFTLGTLLAHCLVVKRDTLAQFANNPFALLQSAVAEGWLGRVERDRPRLNRFTLEGNCEPLNVEFIRDVADHLPPAALAILIQSALAHPLL